MQESKNYYTSELIESELNIKLAPRYRRFLEKERLGYSPMQVDLPHYQDKMEVRFSGEQLDSFINEDWPEDTDEGPYLTDEGLPYGHSSATEIDLLDKFHGWVPIAIIGDEESQVLLCNASIESCPVAMWEHETDELVTVSDSLDEFLSNLSPV